MELMCCGKCVHVNVCLGGRADVPVFSPVGYILDLILKTPHPQPPQSDNSFLFLIGYSLVTFLLVFFPPPSTQESALTSFCMAQGYKWSLMMLSAALSGVWTTAEPDPCTPQAVPTAGTPRPCSAWPAVARSQPDLHSHHPAAVQSPGCEGLLGGSHVLSSVSSWPVDKHTRPHASSV